MLYIVFSLILSLVVSLILMPWLLKTCYRFRLFDNFDHRKVHKQQIPRLGGVVFVPAAVIAVVGTFVFQQVMGYDDYNLFHQSSMVFGFGGLLVYFVGILDDLFEVGAKFKLLVQLFVACAFPVCGLYINSFYGELGVDALPLWFAYPFSVFVTVLIVNAINLIDGIDGLAAGLSVFALGVIGYHFYEIRLLVFCICVAALIGTLLVYIPYNLWGTVDGKTKTFMGDSGSLFLGVVLAYLCQKYAMDSSPHIPRHDDGLVVAYSVMLVPCFDLCRVALCRLKRGRGIFAPDKTHLHHKFLAAGIGMHPTLFLILFLQVGFYVLNMVLFHLQVGFVVIVVVDTLIFTLLNVLLPVEKTEKLRPSVITLPERNGVRTTAPSDSIDRMDSPLVSIITSTYNSAATLRDTFESILNQTYKNYELIVVDGVSKDETMDIVRAYEPRFEGRMKYKSEPDRGLYEAMNKGYAMASGEIVGLLNSDDFYSADDVLERVAKAFSKSDVDAVYGDVHYVNASNIQQVTRYYSSRLFRPWLMRFGFMPAHPSFYCRRMVILDKGLFNLKYRVAADFDQIFRLIYKDGIKTEYLHKDFVTMREGGVSNSNLTSRMTIMTEHKDILSNGGLFTNTFLLSLRYIYKILEIIISPYMSNPELPAYVQRPREE